VTPPADLPGDVSSELDCLLLTCQRSKSGNSPNDATNPSAAGMRASTVQVNSELLLSLDSILRVQMTSMVVGRTSEIYTRVFVECMTTWLAVAFSARMLDQQMPADAFDIDHSQGSAFAEGLTCRFEAAARTACLTTLLPQGSGASTLDEHGGNHDGHNN
jgi:hypothetical protein